MTGLTCRGCWKTRLGWTGATARAATAPQPSSTTSPVDTHPTGDFRPTERRSSCCSDMHTHQTPSQCALSHGHPEDHPRLCMEDMHIYLQRHRPLRTPACPDACTGTRQCPMGPTPPCLCPPSHLQGLRHTQTWSFKRDLVIQTPACTHVHTTHTHTHTPFPCGLLLWPECLLQGMLPSFLTGGARTSWPEEAQVLHLEPPRPLGDCLFQGCRL